MKHKVLLIEDNEQNAYLARFLLEQAGCEVRVTRTGTEGLEVALSGWPEIILLDIQLPDVDGYTIASTLRREKSMDGIAIVALTSFAMAGERKKALDLGCNGYIEKPIEPLKFVDQVKKFLPAPEP